MSPRVETPATARRGPHMRTFRRANPGPRLTPEQKRRQSDVLRHAWHHFGEAGPVIAFLNTRHRELQGQPLQVALHSDEGLLRVDRLLAE
ncbi:MAG: hypothetical protein ACJ8EZ_04160, partial [Sphingomicrobium sp.]